MRHVLHLVAAVAVALLALAPPSDAQEKRAALVLGNGAYKEVAKLPNPPNDAHAIAAALGRLGFAVTEGYDLTNQEMVAKIRAFGRSLEQGGDVALVFYAGHGMQVAGRNYLLPIDAKLEREQDLRYEAVPLETILDEAQGAQRIRVVILDACRDNPFTARMVRSMGASRSALIGRGLGRVDNLASDTLIA